jgi:hypothetical protein
MSAILTIFGANGRTIASDTAIPGYFFAQWTISADCTEQHGPEHHVALGLKLRIDPDSADPDTGGYALQTMDTDSARWDDGWKSLELVYRPGAPMTRIPADFVCTPGAASSSPFLAMSNYVTNGEPWYEYEHWYALISIQGQLHHVLIFPRAGKGPATAIIVLQTAAAGSSFQLNHGGVVTGDD